MDDKFGIKIGADKWGSESDHELLTTKNGYQWHGLCGLTLEQLKQISDAILEYIKQVEKEKQD